MLTSGIHAFSAELSRQGVLLCFNGPFSHALIEEFGRGLRQYLQGHREKQTAISDVFSVYIEQAQNIRRYMSSAFASEDEADAVRTAIVMVAREGESFAVCSGNRVKRDDTASLRAHIERVQTRDKAALKAMYKQRLKESPTDQGGAGLGFIGMARVASEPIDFALQEVDASTSFFSLRVVI